MRLAPLRRLGLWWVIAAFAVVGLALIVFAGRLRVGGFVIGVGLVVAALLRLFVREPHGGGIEVRSRARDIITLIVAAGLVFAAFFLVRTCGPADSQLGGGRATSCPP